MQATVNRLLFTTTVFDSGSLGMLTSVIHQFSTPGVYQAVIQHSGQSAGVRSFEVVGEGGEMQLNIDLAAGRLAAPHAGDCHCKSPKGSTPRVSAKGYVLFYVSQGQGYSVVAGPQGEKSKAEFNSQSLGAGDLFALSLLEPTKYSMVNRKGGAKGEIVVSAPEPQKKALGTLDAQYVEVTESGFNPKKLSVASTQGIVFRIQTGARIVIERQSPRRAGDDDPVRPVRFAPLKPRPVKTVRAKRTK